MSNRHPPGSDVTDEESVISSNSNDIPKTENSFSDPMDNAIESGCSSIGIDDSSKSSVEGS